MFLGQVIVEVKVPKEVRVEKIVEKEVIEYEEVEEIVEVEVVKIIEEPYEVILAPRNRQLWLIDLHTENVSAPPCGRARDTGLGGAFSGARD